MLARVACRTTPALRFLPVLLIGFWLAEAFAWPHFANAEDGGSGSGGGGGGGTGGGSGSAGEGEGSSPSAAAGASGQARSGPFDDSGALRKFVDRFEGNPGPAENSGSRNPILDALVAEQRLASAAVSQGKIRPLSEILHAVSDAVPGSILSVHLRQEPAGSWIYKFVILSPEGHYRKITVDATNSRITQIK